MKKLFTLITFLVCSVTSWGQTTLFSWHMSGTTAPTIGGTVGTATGGTLTFNTTDIEKKWTVEGVSYVDGVDEELKAESTKGIKNGANALYITLTLSSGKFQEGDIIEICGYNGWEISSSTSLDGDIVTSIATGESKSAYAIGSATLPAGTSTNTLYLSRAQNSSTAFSGIRITRPSDTKTTVSTPVITSSIGSNYFTTSATISITDETEGASIFYSTDGTNFSKYTNSFPITSTTTIYTYATKDEMTQSGTISATFSKVAPSATATINGTLITPSTDFSNTSLRLNENITLTAAEGSLIYTQWSSDATKYATAESVVAKATGVASPATVSTATNGKRALFVVAKDADGNLSSLDVYTFNVTSALATIGATGYTSFSSKAALDFTKVNGLKAYAVEAVNTTSLKLAEVQNAVPAKTGVILNGAQGEYTIPVASSSKAPEVNLLTCNESNYNLAAGDYYLGTNDGTTARFFLHDEANGTKTLAGYHAYIKGENVPAGAKSILTFTFGEVTAINGVDAAATSVNGPVYNTVGQKVSNNYKGIVIKNGKKFILK